MYKSQRNYENAQRAIYSGTGEYQIPEIEPTRYEGCDWIGFNYAGTAKGREKN